KRPCWNSKKPTKFIDYVPPLENKPRGEKVFALSRNHFRPCTVVIYTSHSYDVILISLCLVHPNSSQERNMGPPSRPPREDNRTSTCRTALEDVPIGICTEH
ncbi:hypothetical protein KC19_VG201100, partial [Ceratodon purpureus]